MATTPPDAPPEAPPVAPPAPPPPPRTLAVFLRHQLGAAMATVVDFVVMTLAREAAGLSVALATVLGAFAGGVANLELGRTFVFGSLRPAGARHRDEALRYGLVWAGSALLNAAAMKLAVERAGAPMIPARAVVSLAVGVLWNYPLHRRFVFEARPRVP